MRPHFVAACLASTFAIAQSLPHGFVQETLAPNQHGPIALDFLPDGRVVFVEQHTGAVKVLATAAGNAVATVGTVTGLVTSYSQGLLSIAVDPQWPTRPFVYCYHTNAAAADLRVTRFTVTGSLTTATSTNLQLGTAYTVLSGVPDNTPLHEAGCLRFGPDGMMWLTTGEDDDACKAQDVTSLLGKLLRMRVDTLPAGAGSALRSDLVPPGNPFAGPGDIAPLVWAYGLRNPFRFHVDPANGAVFVADVGDAQRDEIDRLTSGGSNLGWPWFEADLPLTTCTGSAPGPSTPIAVHAVPPQFQALISLGVCRVPANAPFRFGPQYDGDYFYTDHFTGRIWRLNESGGAWLPAPPVPGQTNPALWATVPWITDARFGADGALYFCERADVSIGSVRRIRPTAATWSPFGSGCAGSFGTPSLVATGGSLPVLGGTLSLQIAGLPAASSLSIGLLGVSKSSWDGAPLPADLTVVGMPSCTLLVQPLILTALLGGSGTAPWPFAVPSTASFVGQDLYAQALVLDAGWNPFGAVLTNAGEGVIR
ncbi:MAG: PQQ-dependent sugar dehydrogenase [Planctomycetes bacterium]|nr:PQQ-dependent sugar dehydrogenase [Planctomycetota bacterium]